ncbi:MAG: copper homeostasis protein CutC [Bacteroidales bacterium]|nr:copper homeostasis protein CutC [Bacteroidales bacterium]
MNSNFNLEICANSVDSAIIAQKGGATRVELCENIYEGGTTPSYGAIKLAKQKLSIDINVIIRPRGGDFLYSDIEFDIMKQDIDFAKQAGVDGIVLGILNSDGSIDTKRLDELVKLAAPLPITFHRAFDVSRNPFQALEDIIGCGCRRILTSGQKNKAYEGIELLSRLVDKAKNRIIIMPGSGINETNIREIKEKTKATEFHVSLREPIPSSMIYRNEDVNMSSIDEIDEFEIMRTDYKRVRNIIEILK